MGGMYLGVVVNSNDYYNFEPRFEIVDGELKDFLGSDLELLLSHESERKNINFSYSRSDDFIPDLFYDRGLFIYEYEYGDLEENYSRGGVAQTRYKVDAKKLRSEGKIRDIEDEGLFYVISPGEGGFVFEGDRVEIDDPVAVDGRKVFLELDEYGILAGPYSVNIRNLDNKAIVNTQIKDNKYTISGYPLKNHPRKQCDAGYSTYDDGIRLFYFTKIEKNDERMIIDVITDEQLLELFKNEVSQGQRRDKFINFPEVKEILADYESSLLTGDEIDDHIRNNRLQRIADIFSSQEAEEDGLNYIASLIGDAAYNSLKKYSDTEGVERFIDTLLEEKPGIFDNMGNVKPIQERIDKLKAERERIEEEIQNLKTIREDSEAAVEQSVKSISGEIEELQEEKDSLEFTIKELKQGIDVVKEYVELVEENEYLKRDNENERTRHRELEDGTRQLEVSFTNKLGDYSKQMYDIAFDGFMANKMLEASAQWEDERGRNDLNDLFDEIKKVPVSNKSPEELVEYLCDVIQLVRPGYSRNTIVNIATCFTQGFLTVLWGKPGCGKTSISNIFAQAMGLNKLQTYIPGVTKTDPSRFISVSVERGWTSKRDFIGYFNPLTKAFDKNNRQIFDALRLLDLEQRNKTNRIPYMILLDEANLSSMEYYWADFMNICDDLTHNSYVNLGGDNVFRIPETLHFFATINNDLTTEVLSPRLIDRAWVVTLPKTRPSGNVREIPSEKIEIVSWESMKNTFGSSDEKRGNVTLTVKAAFEKIAQHFEKKHFYISPRTELAVMNYCAATSDLFETGTSGVDRSIIALDYAVSQKILPKIKGGGEDFKAWLIELRQLCSANSLFEASDVIREIIADGDNEISYYEFFR